MKIFIAVLLIIIITTVGYEIYLITFPKPVEEVIVTIEEGETAAAIADKLVKQGVIGSKWFFIIYVRLRGIDKELCKGNYLFSGNLSTRGVIRRIANGQVQLSSVTIPEGLTISETVRIIAEAGFGDYNRYIALCYDPVFAEQLTGFPVNTLEGFLYPDTYFFAEEVSEEYIIRHLVNEFFSKTARLQLPEEFPYSFYQMVILASIVEKEAVFSDEKPLIAGVFLNRLRIGKRLQADPTVAYALRKEGIVRRRIFYIDLEIDSPFNTYRNTGLPPTPICSPSVISMQAVLEPEESDYLYFFADRRGRHIFSKTYRDHINRQRTIRENSG